jgi:type III restriction enzyme
VDKLTVVAHENFEQVITAARDPKSILSKMSFVEIEAADQGPATTVVTSVSKGKAAMQEEEKRVAAIADAGQRQKAQNTLDARKLLIDTINDPKIVQMTTGLRDYEKPEIREMVIRKAAEKLEYGQQTLFKEAIAAEMPLVYQATLVEVQNQIIETPRMDLVQGEAKAWFDDFDLDISQGFDFRMLEEEIISETIRGNVVDTIGVRQGAFTRETPVNQVVSELINFPEVDYDDNPDLLHKLAAQAVAAVETKQEDPAQLRSVVRQYRKVIAGRIYDQMKKHLQVSEPEYLQPKVLPFVKIEDWNFSALTSGGYKDYREKITPLSHIPRYVYRGFEKACHVEYKFDVRPEKDFAYVLEHDKAVIRWLRPAPNQFRIYWQHNTRQYRPDFVVETHDAIYLAETKQANQIDSPEVIDKKKAALKYCEYATQFTRQHGGKPWHYLLIPDNEVSTTSSFERLKTLFLQA